jgi:hypothetical protein
MTRLELEELVVLSIVAGFNTYLNMPEVQIDREKLCQFIHSKSDTELLYVLSILNK